MALTGAIYHGLFGDPEIAACLDDSAHLAGLIRFEAALARVQAKLGVIPSDDGMALAKALDSVALAPEDLSGGTVSSGVPVPALVEKLRAALPEGPGQWLHWGATSQDVVDCAHILQYRASLEVLTARLGAVIDALDRQSRVHQSVVMAGRTRSQIATPITFGLRVAQWAQPLIAAEADLPGLRARLMRVQFGGASGANSAVAPHGPAIVAALAEELDLHPGPPWHTDRSGIQALGAWCGLVAGALEKFAADAILMARSEVGELVPGAGGGSSTMPQKSNPVGAEAIRTLAALTRSYRAGLAEAACPAEERDAAAWAMEWVLVPQMLLALGAGLRHAEALAVQMAPRPERMAETLAAHSGVFAEAASFALAAHMPRAEAKALVKQASSSGAPLAEALSDLSPVTLDWPALLSPEAVIDPCRSIADQIFAQRRQ